MPKVKIATVVLSIFASFGCGDRNILSTDQEAKREQALPLTFGGFLKDGPEADRVSGVCGTDDTRDLLTCDLYNGLPEWTITEITLVVTLSPYGKDDARYYQVPTLIKPRTTEHVTVRLGLLLPTDLSNLPQSKPIQRWNWLVAGAKGYATR
jgi:hypothetical protein